MFLVKWDLTGGEPSVPAPLEPVAVPVGWSIKTIAINRVSALTPHVTGSVRAHAIAAHGVADIGSSTLLTDNAATAFAISFFLLDAARSSFKLVSPRK
jgi:hypothetical protein